MLNFAKKKKKGQDLGWEGLWSQKHPGTRLQKQNTAKIPANENTSVFDCSLKHRLTCQWAVNVCGEDVAESHP